MLTNSPVVPGLDGRKMSKSYGNTIELGEEPGSLGAKIKRMYTDPAKLKVDDKGHPAGCVVFAFHKLYNPAWCRREEECKAGGIGCGACKKHLLELMSVAMESFRARRQTLSDTADVEAILAAGAEKAACAAAKKMALASQAAGLKGL